MNIALVGYGKMGKEIEQVAIERGHTIVTRISNSGTETIEQISQHLIDVAIEFTKPESAFENVSQLLNNGIPVVSGTTGWNRKIVVAKELCYSNNTSFLWASNFSIGVNLFFSLNKYLSSLMSEWQEEYKADITEVHHTQKKDAPSGTAITLADQIIDNIPELEHWKLDDKTDQRNALMIRAERKDEVPGTHSVRYHSAIDDIEIIHTAHSRKGFALGAVLAAEFIARKKGVFTMEDVLFKNNNS